MGIKYYCEKCNKEIPKKNPNVWMRTQIEIKYHYSYQEPYAGESGGESGNDTSKLFCSWKCAFEFLLLIDDAIDEVKHRNCFYFPMINDYNDLIELLKAGSEILNKIKR